MKYLLIAIFAIVASGSQAQITLEHTYPSYVGSFGIVAVDSTELKYIQFNHSDSISIYNLDHTLDRVIVVPIIPRHGGLELLQISKVLWDKTHTYSYLISDNSASSLRVFNENGKTLFSCDSCALHYDQNTLTNETLSPSASIVNTTLGVKMMVVHYEQSPWYITVHGLPGKLTGTAKSKVSGQPGVAPVPSNVSIGSVIPNPGSSVMTFTYSLGFGEDARLELFNILGKSVALVSDGFQSEGEHQISFNIGALAEGAYYLRLTSFSGSAIATVKIIH